MGESKKYWYIQLNVNFFEDERIDWLCEQQNGYAYVVLYLKLCLKTANNNGILTRQVGDMIIPYNVEKISDITHMNVDVVRVALELYKRIGLVYEADENHNFMRLPEVPGMVGYTTQSAIEKARQRERKKQLKSGQCLDICPDISSDKSQDICPDIVQQELRVKSIELRVNNKEKYVDDDSARNNDLATVLDAYMNRINPTPSPSSMDELKGYVQSMGRECCIRAIDAAVDSGKASWTYVRAILRSKASQGVRCIADWERTEKEREEARGHVTGPDKTSRTDSDSSFHGFRAKSALDD